jgi:hypothetical protein
MPKVRQPPFLHWLFEVGTRRAGTGLIAIPLGETPVATDAGLFAASAPPGPTSYCDTVSLSAFET